MNFLNISLLAGAAAFLIPLIIHLLNKRRVMLVRWGPMHLLQEAIRQRKKNLKIEQLLLLIVRISLPILLALCLAQPVLSWFRPWSGHKNSLVVVLDNSYSMRAPGAGRTVRQIALEEIHRIFDGLPKGSDVSIVLAGAPPRLLFPQPKTDLNEINRLLQAEPSLSGPLALNDAFQMAAAELKRMGNTAQEVLLISDFQQTDWKALVEGGSLPALTTMTKVKSPPQVTFYRIPSDLQENLSLASVEPSAFVLAREQTVGLRARIQNHGSRPYQDIAIRLEADGAPVRSTRASVPPNGETILTLSHSFDKPGDHSITVRLEGDTFSEDNAFSLVVPVRDQVNCLLVEGSRGRGPLEGATDFLEIALAPHQSAATTLKDLIHTTTIDSSRHNFEPNITGQEVVVLADVDKIPERTLKALRDFVTQGGGLIIFAGPSNDLRWLEHDFYQGGNGLFPCALEGFGHVDAGQTPARILGQRYTHPATTYFNDARGLRLQDAGFQHWQKFGKIPSDATVLLNLDRGDALAVEKPMGKGRVIAVATSANPEWNNMPLQPVFVPLMQRLVTYLATQNSAPLSQTCGSMLRLALRPEQGKTTFLLTDPQNQVHTLVPHTDKEGVSVQSPDTLLPGVYELRDAQAKNATPQRFAFNLNAAESNLQLLSSGKARETAGRLGAGYAESHDEYERLDRSRRSGTPLWQPVLFALLAFLFGEVFLQQRIAGS